MKPYWTIVNDVCYKIRLKDYDDDVLDKYEYTQFLTSNVSVLPSYPLTLSVESHKCATAYIFITFRLRVISSTKNENGDMQYLSLIHI